MAAAKRTRQSDVRALKERARALMAKQAHAKAAKLYEEVCGLVPSDLYLKQHWAVALHRSGEDQRAAALLREVAQAYGKNGELLRAIAVSKLLLEIDPKDEQTRLEVEELAMRRLMPRGDPSTVATPASPRPVAAPKEPHRRDVIIPPAPSPRTTPARLRAPSTTVARATWDEPTDPETFPPEGEEWREQTDELVAGGLPKPTWSPNETDQTKLMSPLFEALDPKSFLQLLERCRRQSFSEGDMILRQGDPASSFFVLVEGALRVVQGPLDHPEALLEVARLSSGDFFGEIALVSKSARIASVVAQTEGDVLEFPETVLSEIVRESPAARRVLDDFVRARFLQNAMASSQVFRPFNAGQRRHLFPRFEPVALEAGASPLVLGEKADAFYVVASGEFLVHREGHAVATLSAGDFFGDIPLLLDAPAIASVTAQGPGRVFRLPARAFESLVAKHPDVQKFAHWLAGPSASPTRAVSSDKVESDTAGVVLI